MPYRQRIPAIMRRSPLLTGTATRMAQEWKVTAEQGHARGLVVTGKLLAAEPKSGGEGVDYVGGRQVPKTNKLRLVIEVPIPRPTPPTDFDTWRDRGDEDRYQRERPLEDLRRKLEKELAEEPKPVKPPKGAHWFRPAVEADVGTVVALKAIAAGRADLALGACTGHPKCGRTEPDGVKCHEAPAFSFEERKARAQARLNQASAAGQVKLLADYNAYVVKATADTRTALAASLGSGLFFALLNQEVQVTFEPSNRVFQPLLDVARSLPQQVQLETPVLESLPEGRHDEELELGLDDDDDDDE